MVCYAVSGVARSVAGRVGIQPPIGPKKKRKKKKKRFSALTRFVSSGTGVLKQYFTRLEGGGD